MMSRLWKSLLSLFVLLTVLPFQPAAAAVTGFKQVEAGANFSLALKGDGTVWTWGTMSSSQNFSLTHVDGLSNITDIAAGFQHALALQADGTVWAWGENKFGELGDGSETARSLPVKVVGPGGSGSLENVKALAAGNNFSLVLKQDGTIWAWGNNTWGQLGDGTTDKKSTPVQATGLTEMTAIAAGYEHAVALKQDGTVWTMGKNDMGQLGDGTTFGGVPIRQVKDPADPSKPFTGVKAIAAGTNHSIALKNDGTVWVWGANDFGQLGDGTNGGQVLLPKQVLVPDGVVDVPLQATKLVESFNNTFVIKNDKSLWGWGYNSYGQLGTGTEGDRSSPSQVVGPGGAGFLNGVIDVSGGDEHTVALKEDGSIWTWGSNAQSQLGDGFVGTAYNKATPIEPISTSLQGLTLSAGALTPAFSPNGKEYTAQVRRSVNSITFTPYVVDNSVAINIERNGNGVSVGDGAASPPLSLDDGPNVFTVSILPQNGSQGTSYKVTVNRVNLWPVASNDTVSTRLNTPVSGTLKATDADNDPLTYSIVTNGTKGTAEITNPSTGAFTYTPKPDESGTDQILFKANDGLNDSSNAVLTINVQPNNQPVVVKSIPDQTIMLGKSVNINLGEVFSDPDNDSLALNATSTNNGIVDYVINDPLLVIQAKALGDTEISVEANDSYGGLVTETFTVTVVEAANQLPIASNGTVNTKRNTPVTGKLTASDADNDPLTYRIVTNGSKGTAEITNAANGSFTYTPLPGVTGTDTFDFQVSDGKENSNIATVTVKINAPVTPQPQYYPVEAIELDRTEWTLKVGESAHRLQANIKPEYATNKQVIWESTNPIVATVDATGVVTPLQPGATTIRVTTLDGNKTAECVVKVLAASSEVTGVELDSHELVLKTVGAKKKLKAKVLPGNATNQKVTWKSSNQKVAKVDENGVVTAVSSGEATITVTTEDGGNTDTCLVLVPSKDIVRLEVSELNMLMKPAASAKLQVYAVDQRGKKTNIASHKLTRIVSSDSDIVTVKRSTIKAGNEAGDAILTITHQGHKIQVKVKVSTISVTTLTPSSETVSLKSGKSEQLEVKASMSDDSEQDVTALATWSSSNAEIVKVSAGGKLTAKKAGKATIKAVYGGKTVTITVTVTRK